MVAWWVIMISDGPKISPSIDPGLRQRFPLYPSQLIAAITMASMGPLLDSMMRDLGIPLSNGGLISAGFFLGGVIGIVLVNTCMARVPAKWALVGGLALLGIALVVAGAAAWDQWSLSLAYLLVGVTGAVVTTTNWIWLSAHIKKDIAASALLMIAFFGVGMVVTPVILGPVLDRGASWRWVLAMEGGLTLALALALVFLPMLDIPGRHNVRLSHLKQVVAHNRGLLLGMMGAGFMYTGAESTINVWLPKFQIDVFDSGDAWASLSVTLFWVGLVVGRLTTMPLARRFSPARLLPAYACILAIFCVATALSPSQSMSLLCSVGAGLGASATYGLIGSYAARFPEWQSGVATSAFMLSGAVGSVALPYIMGPIASSAGFRVGLAVVAVPALACGLFSLLIRARSEETRG